MREDGKKGETRVKKYKEGSLESEKRAERKKNKRRVQESEEGREENR